MKINFFKMHAQGNDYCYCDLDYNDGSFLIKNASEISVCMSKRRFSVGSDGLILIERDKTCDAKIKIYNADGSMAKVCGNGLRCVAYYLSNKLCKRRLQIKTFAGDFFAEVHQNYVLVNMKKPKLLSENLVKKEKSFNDYGVEFYDFVYTGNKHLVLYFGENCIDNGLIDRFLSNNKDYNGDYNIETVYKKGSDFFVRVFERGSGETYCCGSGAVAVYYLLNERAIFSNRKTPLNFKGGKVFLEKIKGDVYLEGEVEYLYEGVYNYD